ncbi:MAG: right-handed parallel beta-helix repeat-containing protein [Phycisphaerales bacterium]|nr:MAG: right-handed parallel beta-helix repeat-containing protein [Phycisphaerales bacterium]
MNKNYCYAAVILLSLLAIGIQPAFATKYIRDDETGGDATSIGIWDRPTKTCIMNQDVSETIAIVDDGITLDGAGHTVTGGVSGNGVYLERRTRVIVKNLTVQGFHNGILVEGTQNEHSTRNTVTNNVINSYSSGIRLDYCSNNEVTGNTVSGCTIGTGIVLYHSSDYAYAGSDLPPPLPGNTVTDNTLSNNGWGISIQWACDNKIYNNNFIDNATIPDGAQAEDAGGSGNVFDWNGSGNYWNDWSGSGPYTFPGGQDNHPLADPVPSNQPPIANANGPYTGDEGSPVVFDASGSDDPDGDELQYRWDFDSDGVWDTGWSTDPTASNTWGDDWTGTATVEVSDGQVTADATASVTVNNVAPTVSIDTVISPIPEMILPGDELSFTGSFTDSGWLDIHTALWDFGDDSTASGTLTQENEEPDATGAATAEHIYTAYGEYTVTLQVTDDDGATGTDTVEITVVSVQDVVQDIIDYIELMLVEGVPPEAEKEMGKAVEELNKAIDEFNNDKIDRALGKIAKAVKQLMKAQKDGADTEDTEAAIDGLVDLAQAIAEEAIDYASDTAGADNLHVVKAQEHYDNALQNEDDGKYDKAVKEFNKAYKEAMKALG